MKSREISRSKIGPFPLACTDPYIGIGWEYQSTHALHECIIETTDTKHRGFNWSIRSLVISTLVISHLFIGQFDLGQFALLLYPSQLDPHFFSHFCFRVLIKRNKSNCYGGWTLLTVKNLLWVRSLTGLDAGFRKVLFVLNNSKQKHKKFLNFHQNSLENEIIFAKRGVAPSERNATLRLF